MKFICILLVACLVITLTEAAPNKERDGKGKEKKENKDGKRKEMELGCHRV